MPDELTRRLVRKIEEVRRATRGVDALLTEAAAAGLTHPPSAPRLSPREHLVLEMVADGMTNRDIADELELSRHTVKDHLSAVYRRLGAENRAAAVKRAREVGLI